jgi:hypothetical protein
MALPKEIAPGGLTPLSTLENERARLLAAGTNLRLLLTVSLVQDALGLGARKAVVIANHPSWGVVAADRDWISSDEVSMHKAFSELLLWPRTSKYWRRESLVLAVSSSVFVWRGGSIEVLRGEAPSQDVVDLLTRHNFAVGFRCG